MTVTASNFSDRTRQIPVSLFANEAELGQQILRINAGDSSVASFQLKCPEATSFRFSIPPDNLTADDQAFVAVATGSSTSVTIISDDATDAVGSSKFFLERAVRPFDSDRDRYQVRHLDTRSVKRDSLAGQQIVMVGYVAGWNNPAIDELVKFVRTGGRLIYLCGEGNVAGQLTRIEQRADAACFPFRLTQLNRIDDFDDMLQIQSGKWRSRWLRAFDLSSQVALQQIRFNKAWSVSQIREGAEVLLQFSDDRPALGYKTFNDGTIVMANLSPSVEFSEFGKFGSFAALMQIIVGQLRDHDADMGPILAGSPVTFVARQPENTEDGPERATWRATGPSGEQLDVQIVNSDGPVTGLIDRAPEPGLYQLWSGKAVVQNVAVATDLRESDLAYLNPGDVDAIGKEGSEKVVSPAAFGLDLIDQGEPLWGWLAVGSVLMLTCESFLLGWWKR